MSLSSSHSTRLKLYHYELLSLSGILTVFFCGIVMSHYTWHNITESSRITTKHAFATISFVAEPLYSFMLAWMPWTLTNGRAAKQGLMRGAVYSSWNVQAYSRSYKVQQKRIFLLPKLFPAIKTQISTAKFGFRIQKKTVLETMLTPSPVQDSSFLNTSTIIALAVFFTLLYACIIIGHFLEENQWSCSLQVGQSSLY